VHREVDLHLGVESLILQQRALHSPILPFRQLVVDVIHDEGDVGIRILVVVRRVVVIRHWFLTLGYPTLLVSRTGGRPTTTRPYSPAFSRTYWLAAPGPRPLSRALPDSTVMVTCRAAA